MTFLSLSTASLYGILWLSMILPTTQNLRLPPKYLRLGVSLAIALHCYITTSSITEHQGFDFGFFKMVLLLFVVINLLLLISSLKKSVFSLFILLLPLNVIAILAHTLLGQTSEHPIDLSAGIAAHILSSILAYSLLTIATLQALLLTYQEYQLKHHTARKVLRVLPPLQTMDKLLFEVIGLGAGLLCVSVATGVIFIDNLFAQQLAHKTLFSIMSAAIYSVLIWGRFRYGWRGTTATKWVLSGFCLLMLAYFGTKFVLELILTTS